MKGATRRPVVKVTANVPGAMRVDRGTAWGNPFIMHDESDRNKVCALYEKYARWRLRAEPLWLEPLRKAKALACWCAPRRCHAETLERLLREKKSL